MVRYGSHVVADGEAFVEAARQQELEGVVAKLRRSPYEPGRRSKSWLKIKLRREQEVVVAGWLEGQGSHRDLGSLIVAVHEGDRLRHAGQVGSGIDTKTRRELRARLDELARDDAPLDPVPRLRGAHWVEPRIVIRVEFAEWTTDGLLRQAAFKGFEIGKAASAVRRERPVDTARAASAARAGASRMRLRVTSRPGGACLRRRAAAAPVATKRTSSSALAALDAIAKEGTWTFAGRELRVTNLDKVLFRRARRRAAAHQARPAALPRHASARSWCRTSPAAGRRCSASRTASRRRGSGRRTCPATRPRGSGAGRTTIASEGAEGLRGGRGAGHARLARAGGSGRAPSVDEPDRCARQAHLRADRHRPGRVDDLRRGARPRPPLPDRARAPRRPRRPEGDRASAASRSGSRSSGATRSTRRATGSRASRARWGRRCRTSSAGSGRSGAPRPGAPRLHPERDQQDPRRALLAAAGPGRAGLGPDPLGGARRPGARARIGGRSGRCPLGWPRWATSSPRRSGRASACRRCRETTRTPRPLQDAALVPEERGG